MNASPSTARVHPGPNRLVAAITLTLLVGLGACSGSSDDGASKKADATVEADAGGSPDDSAAIADPVVDDEPAPTTVDPCSLVTRDEASEIVGVEFDEMDDSMGNCAYRSMDLEAATSLVQVQIGYQVVDLSGMGLETFAEGVAAPLDNTEITKVDGFDREAFFATGGLIPMYLIEVDGGVLTVALMGGDDTESMLRELSDLALSRL